MRFPALPAGGVSAGQEPKSSPESIMQIETRTATAPAKREWHSRVMQAVKNLDGASWLAVALTFTGWFLLDTLRVEWGPIERRIPFYDVAVLAGSPMQIVTGLEGRIGVGTVLFSLLCCVTLLGPLAAHLWRNRFVSLAGAAPLALILGCAFLLYARTSGDFFVGRGGPVDTIANDLRHLANHVVHNAGAAVSHHVTFVAGGYLALFASLYLAARAVRGFRTHRS
jgi:hypothetical protein